MSVPTHAAGYVDDNIYLSNGAGQLVDMVLETVPELFWPYSIRTYARMRHDPQLAAVLKAYTYPIRRAPWAIDGSNCRPEVTQLVADDLGLPILGQEQAPSGVLRRRFQWGEHLRLSLLDLTFGHMAFERIYDMSSGQARLGGVFERMPQTIQAIKLTPEGGIDRIKQHFAPNPNANDGIPANALVWYAHEREGTNWIGNSLLRPSWAFWLLKNETARVHATSIRRFGTGILEVQAPPGATPGQVAEAQRYASQIRVSETGGAGLPPGFTSSLRGMVGSVPDAVAFIKYLDGQMTRATLTSILDLADTTHGSRALGETFMDVFLIALQTIADAHAEQATAQLVVPLVDANWGEDEPAPKIICGDVASQHEVTAQTMQLLVTSGALSPDPALDEYIRRQYKLPERTTPWEAPHSVSVPDPTQTYPDGATDPAVVPDETPATVAAAADSGHTGVAIMAFVEPKQAAELAVPGGEPAESLHVTLGFLDKPAAEYDDATRSRLNAALAATYPGAIGADAFAVAAFNADNGVDDEHPPCTVLLVQSDALARAHDAVLDVVDAIEGVEPSTTFPIWTPHVTLGYSLTPADVPPGRLTTIMFDRLIISWGDEQFDLSARIERVA